MKLFFLPLSSGEAGIVVNETTVINNDFGTWVIGSRGLNQISVESGWLKTSKDGGVSFSKTLPTSEADNMHIAWMFDNGNILLQTNTNKLFLTDIDLSFLTEKFALDENNNPLTPTADGELEYWCVTAMSYDNGTNVLVWGATTNVIGGAVPRIPVRIYYSDDYGVTIKTAKRFSEGPADNPRHIHRVAYSKYSDRYLVFTGDNPPTDDILWQWGSFNGTSWTWTDIFGELPQGRMKCAGAFFREINGEEWIYFGAENDNLTADEVGIWRCKTSELTDFTKHERILSLESVFSTIPLKVIDFFVDENTGLLIGVVGEQAAYFSNHFVLIAEDFGHGDWQIKDYTGDVTAFSSMTSQDANGFYRFNKKFKETLQGETLMVKPGLDLFNNVGYDYSKP